MLHLHFLTKGQEGKLPKAVANAVKGQDFFSTEIMLYVLAASNVEKIFDEPSNSNISLIHGVG